MLFILPTDTQIVSLCSHIPCPTTTDDPCNIDATVEFLTHPAPASPPDSGPIYSTAFGDVTFQQLHDATRDIAAAILRRGYFIENRDDMEECLQIGYLKLWEKLQKEPDFVRGKDANYIARSVCFRCKWARVNRRHHAEQNTILTEAVAVTGHRPHSRESRQVDQWVDLEAAITEAAHHYADSQKRLLALYYVLTDVRGSDMQRELGHSRHTLRDHAKEVRTFLQEQLRPRMIGDTPQ